MIPGILLFALAVASFGLMQAQSFLLIYAIFCVSGVAETIDQPADHRARHGNEPGTRSQRTRQFSAAHADEIRMAGPVVRGDANEKIETLCAAKGREAYFTVMPAIRPSIPIFVHRRRKSKASSIWPVSIAWIKSIASWKMSSTPGR